MNELRQLHEENDMLKEEVRQLRNALRWSVHTPLEWQLTNMQERIFFALLGAERVSRETLMNRVYWEMNEPPLVKVLDVHVLNIRRKLKPYGVNIITIYCFGWAVKNRMEWRRRLGL